MAVRRSLRRRRKAGHHRRSATDEQTFDGAAAWFPAANQPCRKHARVVDDDNVAWIEQIGDAINRAVRTKSSTAIEMQKTRRAANGWRVLRDELGRKVKKKLADIHPRAMLPRRKRSPRSAEALAKAERAATSERRERDGHPGSDARRRPESSSTPDPYRRRCAGTNGEARLPARRPASAARRCRGRS